MDTNLTSCTTGKQCGSPCCRRGSMIIELVVSSVLLATLLVTISQVLVLLHRQTRLADRRFVAQQVLENLMEEFSSRPWNELSTAAIPELTLPEEAQAKLPHVALGGEVVDETDPTAAKRISLRLAWQDFPGADQEPLVLTTWVFRKPDTTP